MTRELCAWRTSGRELFSPAIDVNSGLPPFRVLRATRQEATSDKLVNALFITGKIGDVIGWMNWRMRFVVVFALSRCAEAITFGKLTLSNRK
jgi:hypothetical protein